MRFSSIVVFVVLGLIAATVIGVAVTTVLSAARAEDRYQATCAVLDGITHHLKTTGEWPRNWDELHRSNLHSNPRWPADDGALRRRIRIDFEVTAAEVASMTAETFDAIEPLGRSYPLNRSPVETLLDTAKETISRRRTLRR